MAILEAAAIFLLAMYLLRLAICYLSQIWWVLLTLVVLGIAFAVGWRIWKNKRGGY
jgi:predicted negative regulator of RcsB-dependent stress response